MTTITVDQDKQLSVDTAKINSGLVAFDERKATLESLKEKATGLKIVSIDDKATIKEVSEIRKELKSARVEIEKEGKSMRDQLTKVSRHISAKEKELIDIIEPTEKELLAQEKWVESEKERIRLEAEQKEKERIQARIDRLAEYGFTIDYTLISSIADEEFENVVADAKAAHERELAAKAEQERIEREAEEKRKADEEAERARLRAEREELERLRAEQEKIRQDQEAERKRIEEQEAEWERKENERLLAEARLRAEKEERLWRDRLDLLNEVTWNGVEAVNNYDNSIVATRIDLIEWADEYFESFRIEHNKKQAQLAHDARIERERIAAEKAKAEQERIAQLQKEAAEKALRDKEEADRLAKEREEERQAMLSDKEKFRVLFEAIRAVPIPEMKSAKANRILSDVKEILDNAAGHIENNVLQRKAVA